MAHLLSSNLRSIFAPIDLALAPLRALCRGHAILVFFTSLISIPVWFTALFFGKIMAHIVTRWTGTESPLVLILPSVVYLGIWMVALPFFLTAILLPIRLLWHNENLKIDALLRGTLPTLQRAAVATVFTALGLLLIALALNGALGSVDYVFAPYISELNRTYVEYSILALLGLMIIRVILFFLALPIVSISLGLSFSEARHTTLQTLRSCSWLLMISLLAAGFCLYQTNLFFHAGSFTLSEISVVEAATYGCILWYLTVISGSFVLGINESEATNYIKALRSAASPIKVKNELRSQPQLDQTDDSKKRKVLAEKRRRATTALTPKDVELIFR